MAQTTEAACLLHSGAYIALRRGFRPRLGDDIFVGVKPGAFSVYYGDAPIYHFDLDGRWQRAFIDGVHYLKGLDTTVQALTESARARISSSAAGRSGLPRRPTSTRRSVRPRSNWADRWRARSRRSTRRRAPPAFGRADPRPPRSRDRVGRRCVVRASRALPRGRTDRFPSCRLRRRVPSSSRPRSATPAAPDSVAGRPPSITGVRSR